MQASQNDNQEQAGMSQIENNRNIFDSPEPAKTKARAPNLLTKEEAVDIVKQTHGEYEKYEGEWIELHLSLTMQEIIREGSASIRLMCGIDTFIETFHANKKSEAKVSNQQLADILFPEGTPIADGNRFTKSEALLEMMCVLNQTEIMDSFQMKWIAMEVQSAILATRHGRATGFDISPFDQFQMIKHAWIRANQMARLKKKMKWLKHQVNKVELLAKDYQCNVRFMYANE